jgi:hypothetical protein
MSMCGPGYEIDVECRTKKRGSKSLGGSDQSDLSFGVGSQSMFEDAFLYDQQEHIEEITHHILEESLIYDIYDYVCQRYIPRDAGIFKFYFMTTLSLQKIADASGYSVGFIHKTVTRIKLDVQQAFKLRRLK